MMSKGQRIKLDTGLDAVIITVPNEQGYFKARDWAEILGTKVYHESQVVKIVDTHYDEWNEVIKDYISPYSKY